MENIERVQRAIDYIEAHLKDELSIEDIAAVACFSMWHFQRVFSAVVGDSVKGYVRQRRLASALLELGTTPARILDIALDHRFESQESFARAFKTQFGKTPGECRKTGISTILVLTKPRITLEYLDHLYEGVTMQPRFEQIQEMTVIGLGQNFISKLSPDTNKDVIRNLWNEFRKRLPEIRERKSQTNIGIVEIPQGEKAHPDEYSYVAGTEVRSADSIPAGMVKKIVPSGRYAVFTHKGSVEKLDYTLRYIFGSWLPRSNEQLRESMEFSIYGDSFKADSEDSEIDIYIPVV